jgi:type II secretory pathway pseudopilin PulG
MQRVLAVKRFPGKVHVRPGRMSGFSLIESMIVVTLIMIASGMFFMSMQPALKDTRVTNAPITMRRAREAAIAERRTYVVTFDNVAVPNTVTITQAATGQVIATESLPSDIFFRAEPGIPTTLATTPDHFGTGSPAIAFDQGVAGGAKNVICFMSDGSAQDVNSNSSNNGVIYLARNGDLYSSRAITRLTTRGRSNAATTSSINLRRETMFLIHCSRSRRTCRLEPPCSATSTT